MNRELDDKSNSLIEIQLASCASGKRVAPSPPAFGADESVAAFVRRATRLRAASTLSGSGSGSDVVVTRAASRECGTRLGDVIRVGKDCGCSCVEICSILLKIDLLNFR